MNTRRPTAKHDIAVVCGICQTRIHATVDQIGRHVVCPDCQASNLVKAPQQSVARGDLLGGKEYRLADESAPSTMAAEQLVKVVCGTCYTLMYARLEHVGRRVRCPDCDSITVVPRPPAKKPRFSPPDASDVVVEAGPPPLVDEKRREIAGRLLTQATEEVKRRASHLPRPVKAPLRDRIYNFPFYVNVLPLWIGTAIALLVDAALLDALIDLINGGGMVAIMAAFLAPIVAIVTISIVGFVAPHFLTIIEFTAEGYDKIPYWPSQDMFSRGRAMLFGLNALAMATMPGMLLVGLLRPLGVPLEVGLVSTVLLLPLVMLSMAENDSVFAPFSSFVFRSLRRHFEGWCGFYLQVILLALGIVAVDYLVWTAGRQGTLRIPGISADKVSRIITVTTVCFYAVIYCRLVGRMAWILGQDEVQEVGVEVDVEVELDEAAASE
jgi:DNA-directed RNA polymerase subunit RPC12/RpoP